MSGQGQVGTMSDIIADNEADCETFNNDAENEHRIGSKVDDPKPSSDDAHEDKNGDKMSSAEADAQAVVQRPELPGKNKKQKVMWVLALLGVVCGFGFHLSTLITRYFLYPVSTEMQKQYSFDFPDVTLCSTSPFAYFYNAEKFPTRTQNRNRTNEGVYSVSYHLMRYLSLMTMTNLSDHVMPKDYDKFPDARLLLKQFAYRKKLFADPYDFLLSCEFNSQPCDYRNFTTYYHEKNFKCITFCPTNRTLRRSVAGNGLYLVLHVSASNRLSVRESVDHVEGMQFTLHQPGVKPNFEEHVNLAVLSQKTSASVEAQVQKKVSRPSYRCERSLPNVTYVTDYSQLDAKNISYTTFVGSENDCQVRLMQQQYLTECNCLATHLPLPADMFAASDGVCHQINETLLLRKVGYNSSTKTFFFADDPRVNVADYLLANPHLYQATRQRLLCYERVKQQQLVEGVDSSECPELCSKTSYTVTPLIQPWPKSVNGFESRYTPILIELLQHLQAQGITSQQLKSLIIDISKKIDKLAVLDLYAKETAVYKSIEDFAYPIENFFSDFGGILGLWMGLSIVTVIEVTDALLSGLLLYWKKISTKFSNRAASRSDNSDEFSKDKETNETKI